MSSANGYVYLNLANQWPLFALNGVEIAASRSTDLRLFRRRLCRARGICCRTIQVSRRQYPLVPAAGGIRSAALRSPRAIFYLCRRLSSLPTTPTPRGFSGPGWLAAPRDVLDLLVLNANATQLWIGGILRTENSAVYPPAAPNASAVRPRHLRKFPAHARIAAMDRTAIFWNGSCPCTRACSAALRVKSPIYRVCSTRSPHLTATLPPGWLGSPVGSRLFSMKTGRDPRPGDTSQEHSTCLSGGEPSPALSATSRCTRACARTSPEPGLYTSMWSLGDISELGFTTMLAPGPAQGAVRRHIGHIESVQPDGRHRSSRRGALRRGGASLLHPGLLRRIKSTRRHGCVAGGHRARKTGPHRVSYLRHRRSHARRRAVAGGH